MLSNASLIRRAAIDYPTMLAGGGALQLEQAKAFWLLAMNSQALMPLVRQHPSTAKVGMLPTLGFDSRKLRARQDGTDSGLLTEPTFSNVPYTCKATQIMWAVNNDAKRTAINDGQFESTLVQGFTEAFGSDVEDLCINGDETSVDPFVLLNSGWMFQINAALAGALIGQNINGALYNAGKIAEEHFSRMLEALPAKYGRYRQQLRWLMSPVQYQKWLRSCSGRADAAGTAALLGMAGPSSPFGIPIVEVPTFPSDKVVLTWPSNLAFAYTYNMEYEMTDQGKEALAKHQSYHCISGEFDPIVQEVAGCVHLYGLV